MSLIPVLEGEFDDMFSAVKCALYPYVEKVFGWDDSFQRNRLKTDYEPSWFYWLISENKRVGLLCYKPYDNAYHVHLLIVFPEHQNQRIGVKVMDYIAELAKIEQRDCITLSSFRCNVRALSFYQRLGYQVVGNSDEHFVSLSLRITD